jgi:hypothetical protein
MTKRCRGGEIAANAALVAFSLLVALAMAEVVLRIAEPEFDGQPLVRWMPGTERGLELLPNRDVVRYGVRIRTNSLGQRGDEYTVQKPPGTFRIVGLGDSYTFGTGVDHDDTYLAVLERLLGDTDATVAYEAINFGIEGYNTEQALHYFREHGLALSPDLVLLGYVYNDVEEGVERGTPSVNPGVQEGGARGRLGEVIFALKAKSKLFATLSPRVGALLRRLGAHGVGEVGGFEHAYDDASPGWQRSRAALLAIRDGARSAGADFAVIVLPVFVSLDEDSYPLHGYHAAVVEFCRMNGIPVLDVYPTFEGMRAGRYWITLNDSHPNAEANRMIAGAIRAFLTEQRLVPAAGGAALTSR